MSSFNGSSTAGARRASAPLPPSSQGTPSSTINARQKSGSVVKNAVSFFEKASQPAINKTNLEKPQEKSSTYGFRKASSDSDTPTASSSSTGPVVSSLTARQVSLVNEAIELVKNLFKAIESEDATRTPEDVKKIFRDEYQTLKQTVKPEEHSYLESAFVNVYNQIKVGG